MAHASRLMNLLLLTNALIFLRFPEFSLKPFFLFQGPIYDTALYISIVSLSAVLVVTISQTFLCFSWLWQFWELLAGCFVKCHLTGMCLMFSSWLDWDAFWRRRLQRSSAIVTTSHTGYLLSKWLTTVDVKLNHLASGSICQASPLQNFPFPPFPTLLFERKLYRVENNKFCDSKAQLLNYSTTSEPTRKDIYHRFYLWYPGRPREESLVHAPQCTPAAAHVPEHGIKQHATPAPDVYSSVVRFLLAFPLLIHPSCTYILVIHLNSHQ